MNILKPLVIAVAGLTVGMGGTSAAFAKGHDQGVADGSRFDRSIFDFTRGGVAFGLGGRERRDGVGFDPDNGIFLGVAADLNADVKTFGKLRSESAPNNVDLPRGD